MHPESHTLKILRFKWLFASFLGLSLWLGFYFWLRTWWTPPYPSRWLIVSGIALVYLLLVFWRSLPANHRHTETRLLASLGLGNLLSLGRSFILILFCGFLFSPWPAAGLTAWLPGLLYTLAALPDFFDGIAARLTNHVTRLGEILDITVDSIGVLSVSLLAVQYGQVPGWYLLVGLARYLFLAGIWLRQKMGRPVYELPFSVRRRGYAGVTMGIFFVILYPIFAPPGTHIAATVFGVYLLGGFLWDWGITIGWLPPQPGNLYLRLEHFAIKTLPLVLRLILVYGVVAQVLPNLLFQNAAPLAWIQAILAGCIILGLAGRAASIAALVVLGLLQAAAPLTGLQQGLIGLYANLVFLGTGAFSLWPLENRIIFHRIGDPN